ncbi:MAG: sugar phosphate isomerase/epimerase family protein [Thermodesulfobacteriota bacterium]
MPSRQRAVLDLVRVNAPAVMLLEGLAEEFLSRRLCPEVGLDARALDETAPADLAGLARRFQAAGLHPAVHGPFLDLSPGALDPEVLKVTRARYARTLELAALFEPEHVVFHPGYEWSKHQVYREKWLETSLETWRPLARRAGELGIRLVLENTLEREPEDFFPLFEALAPEGVGFCLDTGHAAAFGRVPLLAWLEALAPRLAVLHLHDNHGDRDEHLALGRGVIDFAALFSFLAGWGMKPAAVTLEPHTEADLWPGVAVLAELWPWPL